MNWRKHQDIFSILVDNFLFVDEICKECLHDVIQIFVSHEMIYTFCFILLNVHICYYFMGILD